MLTAKYMYPDNGYELERQRTAMFLVEGKEYGVKDVLMGQSHTTILLKAWSEFCLYCHGTGIEKVPMTNADRIRTMNDDELSVFLWNFRLEDVATGKVGDFGPHLFRKCLKEWLQQPAEEGQYE